MKFFLACLVPFFVHASESQNIIDSMTPFEAAHVSDPNLAKIHKQIDLLKGYIEYLNRQSLDHRQGREYTAHPVSLDATLEIDFRPEQFMRLLVTLREQFIQDSREAKFHSKNWDMVELTDAIRHLAFIEQDFLRTIYGQLYDEREQHILTYLFGLDDTKYMRSGSEMGDASRRGRLLLQKYVEIVRQHVQELTTKSLHLVRELSVSEIPGILDQIKKWSFHLETMTYHIHRGVTFAHMNKGSRETTLAQLGQGLKRSLRRAEQEFKFRRDGEASETDQLSGIDLNDESAPIAIFDITFLYNGGRHAFKDLESTFQLHRDVLLIQYLLTAGSLIGRSALVPTQSRGFLRIGKQAQGAVVPLTESVEEKLWRIFFAEVGDISSDSLGVCQNLLSDQRSRWIPHNQ